jgi:nitric oxide reductase NorD protein
MAEPEDVLAEGALMVTRRVREAWASRGDGREDAAPTLRTLRRRLELFTAALFPGALAIGIAEVPVPPTFLRRFARRRTAHLHSSLALARVQGGRILLPERLGALPGLGVAARYRLLALEQGARAHRGTADGRPRQTTLERDLYLLAEAAAIDAMLSRMLPRLATAIRVSRREELADRRGPPRPSLREAAVERLVLQLLGAEPDVPTEPFIDSASPVESRRWAAEQREVISSLDGPYRGMVPVYLWGAIGEAPEMAPLPSPNGDDAPTGPTPRRHHSLPRRPRVRDASDDEDDEEPGTWMVRADDLQEKAEDPVGLQRPADRDEQADPGELGDALSELPEARLVRRPDPIAEVLASENPIPRTAAPPGDSRGGGVLYPEWDWRRDRYRLGACAVREHVAPEGPAAWVRHTLDRHASTLRSVRRDFERLRPRRLALRRQRDGAELDVDALVAAHADRRGGAVVDDRFHIDTRPLRRDAAIALLVDASASTDSWVTGDRRIIDIEKEALLVVVEALRSLGDPHAVLAFASEGPSRVGIQVLRRFDEPDGSDVVRRRIAGLEPDGFTRAGAALRHVTAGLMRQPARHRLLLLVSDGRPNDVDAYEGRYGIEDTRMAVAEARMQGAHIFCLTVDREAPRYAPRIFGRDFTVLPRLELLPQVLTRVLQQLVRA